MFKYFWIIVILLVYVPWTLWTLIDFVRGLLECRPLSVDNICDTFFDWIDNHETWFILHLGIFAILVVVSFGTWAQITFCN